MAFAGPKRALLGAVPSWVLNGAKIDLDLANNRYYGGTPASLLSVSRASTGYAKDSAGNLVAFGVNTLRRTDLGLLVEEARTNVVLWCRDQTNAAWTKSNITAALDQIGADGSANSATSLTATAGNGTVLQAITLGSSARFQSAFVKRLVGTGNIQMTMDNGATWTNITTTASYQQLSIPSQTLANPTVGFRIVTNGDSIAVDFVMNEGGTFQTSPILTTTVAATRAADNITATGALLNLLNAVGNVGPVSVFAQTYQMLHASSNAAVVGSGGSRQLLALNSNTGSSMAEYNGSVNLAVNLGSGNFQTGVLKSAVGWDASGRSVVANNGTVGTDSNTVGTATGTVNIGSYGSATSIDGYVQRLAAWNSRLPVAVLKALTA
jgi:hypothetical protein